MQISELQTTLDKLRKTLRIGVIYGGTPVAGETVVHRTHNPRGDKTYQSVAEDIASALSRLGFLHVTTYPEDMHLATQLQKDGIDICWLNTGGIQGYASTCHAASTLEALGIPYVGHNPLNAGLLDNKHAFKHLLAGLHIATGRFMTWDSTRGALKPRINTHFQRIFDGYSGPFIVKPVSGRASLNVMVVKSMDELPDVVADLYKLTDNLVLIEEYLDGAEYCIAITGPIVSRSRVLSRQARAFSFSAIERVLSADELIFTSMDQKPITLDRVRALDPANDGNTYDFLHALAQRVYLDCSLEAPVRLDIRADRTGKLHVLEANPKPDLKRPKDGVISLICAGLEQEGMDYEDLIFSIFANRIDFLLTNRPGATAHIQAKLTD